MKKAIYPVRPEGLSAAKQSPDCGEIFPAEGGPRTFVKVQPSSFKNPAASKCLPVFIGFNAALLMLKVNPSFVTQQK